MCCVHVRAFCGWCSHWSLYPSQIICLMRPHLKMEIDLEWGSAQCLHSILRALIVIFSILKLRIKSLSKEQVSEQCT